MKITKVNYQKSFNIGPFLQEKIGFEADVEAGDSIVDILDNLRSKADEWHKNTNPHLYGEGPLPEFTRPNYLVSPPQTIEYRQVEGNAIDIVETIKKVTSLEELKTYKTLASSDPTKELYKAYCTRLKELSVS